MKHLLLLLCLLSPNVLTSQVSATRLMEASAQKILELESVEYDFKAEQYFKSGHFSRNESRVVFKNMKGGEHRAYSVKGTRYLSVQDKTDSFHFSRAVKDSYLINFDKKSFEVFSNDLAGITQIRVMGTLVMGSSFNHFHRKNPMNVKDDVVFSLEGEKEYGGELCYEIGSVSESYDSGKFLWYIAKSDSLPRGYAFRDGTNELFIKKVNFNPAPEFFVLDEPEGFDSQRITERNLNKAKAYVREADKDGINYPEGSVLPAWRAEDMEGNTWSAGKLKGRVAVLDFWGIWCSPCLRSMPEIQKLYDEFKAAGVEVIGFDVKDKPEKIATYLKRNNYSYTIIPQAEEIAASFKVMYYPSIFIIDQQGKVIHAEKGFRSNAYEEWAEVIRTALEKGR